LQNNDLTTSIIVLIITWIVFLLIAREICLVYTITPTDIYILGSIFTMISMYLSEIGVVKIKEYSSFIKQIRW